MTPVQLSWIGGQIFRNECNARESCLVHWNDGEAFPSLGIGHFIWYPKGVDGPYVESFPAMIDFMANQGVVLPDWLAELKSADEQFSAPWGSKEDLIQTSNMYQVQELRDFLLATRGHQAEFLVTRASRALDRVVGSAPKSERSALSQKIKALTETPGGVYALIDYVNFKGEGLAETERYKGQGWGLLQVLQAMNESKSRPALQAFREAAAKVLTRRAENANKAIEKQQWLPGWLNRLDTYREPG